MNYAREGLPAIVAAVGGSLPFPLDASIVAAFRVGSHSHGTHIPPEDPNGIDDTDYMLVVCPPERYVLGLQKFETHTHQADGLDVVIYEWGKYVKLLLRSNPNVVGTLWLEDEDWYATERSPFQPLREARQELTSMRLVDAFLGYAEGQLYKMSHHAHQGYMGDKRKRLVERWGFDVKNAAHLIRLLRMCAEFMEEAEIRVRRPDAADLIAIKRGEWSLERVKDEARVLFDRIRSAELLPQIPATTEMERLLLQGYFRHWNRPVLHLLS